VSLRTSLQNFRRKMIRENRIYIMPSGRGVLFLLCVIVLILTAATYNNNLIFILAFFMFALFVVSMLQTHYNLKGVRLDLLSADEAFEGEKLTLLFQLVQKRPRSKRALQIRTLSKQWKTVTPPKEDLDPRDTTRAARVLVEAYRRGVHPVPTVALETYYPLGLFRAWKVFRPQGEVVVYPKPEGLRALAPVNFEYGEEDLGLRTSPEGDFGELKPYQAGESYHQIAWKHYARTGQLYTKVHWGEEHKHYSIPWTGNGDTEARLRQMSAWIRQALEENATFEMELPTKKIEAGGGVEQARDCWRALARHPA
jgi:uncharacterized protein (DUF58 family)